MTGSRPARAGGVVLALAVVGLAGCGGGTGGPTSRTVGDTGGLRGVSLVVGTEVGDWSLLVVPRSGGKATSRDVTDPTRVLWTGSTDLPAAREVHALEGPVLVLRTADGVVYRYDPATDSLGRVGHVGSDARWDAWGAYGAYLDRSDGRVLEIGPEGAWEFALSGKPRWASPVEDGGLAVLHGEEGQAGSVWLVNRGDSTPSSRTGPGYAGPGLTTAWGKRLVLTAAGGHGVRVLAVPSLADAEDIDLEGSVSALAASPSSHDVYAALAGPPRVISVNRFSRATRVLAREDTALTALRSAVLGQFLLGREGRRVAWIPLGGAPPKTTEAEWREDLPLGTPSGNVLFVRGDSLYSWTPASGRAPVAVEAPADGWWSAVRWNPAPPPVRMASVDTASAAPRGPALGSSAPRVAVDTGATGTPPRTPPAAPRTAPSDTLAAGSGAADGGPTSSPALHPEAGIYAIVTSAQAMSGVRTLLSELSAAGYPTAIQRYLDDAGQVWYRGMVGPYPSRDAAEAAARQLRRERSLKVWVTEIRPGSLSPENLR
jgi:cell division septation protein DedD